MDSQLRHELMAVARGERPAERFFRGGRVVNVYSGEIWAANVAVHQGRVAYVGTRETGLGDGTEVVDATGRLLSPGLVEPHTHPFVLFNIATLVGASLVRGITAMYWDNSTPAQGWGPAGFRRLMDDTLDLPAHARWLIRPSSAAAMAKLSAAFALPEVRDFLSHPAAAALSEFIWMSLFQEDPHLLACIGMAEDARRRVEGHTPGASAERLAALVAGGITSDHEAISAQEALDRLRLGLWVMLRHSALRRDLDALLPLITERGADTRRIMLTTDGVTPAFIEEHGLVDEMIRRAIRLGLPPIQAIQMATINPATYYRAESDIGGIAPGRRADILVLDGLEGFDVSEVYSGGRRVAAGGELLVDVGLPWARYGLGDRAGAGAAPLTMDPARLLQPDLYRLPGAGPTQTFPVMEMVSDAISRRRNQEFPVVDGWMDLSHHPDVLHVTVLAPDGSQMVRGLLSGFAPGVQGFASTGNVAGHLLVLGRSPKDMARAAARVAEIGGGMALAEAEQVVWDLPLPLLGVMSDQPLAEVAAAERQLLRLMQERGFAHRDIVFCLLFLPADSLPRIRIAPRGIVDIMTGQVLRSPEPVTGGSGAGPDRA